MSTWTTTSVGAIHAVLCPALFPPDRAWRREHLPDDTAFPFVAYQVIDATPALIGDGRKAMGMTDTIQVSVFQRVGEEDLYLPMRVITALNGTTLDGYFNSKVTQVVRLEEDSLLHDAITVEVAYPMPTELPSPPSQG
jgi:hypothetical protein